MDKSLVGQVSEKYSPRVNYFLKFYFRLNKDNFIYLISLLINSNIVIFFLERFLEKKIYFFIKSFKLPIKVNSVILESRIMNVKTYKKKRKKHLFLAAFNFRGNFIFKVGQQVDNSWTG